MKKIIRHVLKTILSLSVILILSCESGSSSKDNISEESGDGSSDIAVTGITLSTSASMVVGDTKQLTAVITPSDATNKNVTWSTSDAGKAIVSGSGMVTTVGLNGGSVTITAATEDGGFTAACAISVNPTPVYSADGISFNMACIPGGITFPVNTMDIGIATVANPFRIGETEVTYRLWKKVYDWATTDAGGGKRADGGELYYFANKGREGNDGTIGTAAANQEPVTTVNWRDSMVFCNALTEWLNAKNGTSYTCAYYTDSSYSTPHRDSRDGSYGSALNPNDGGFDKPYVMAAANGNLDIANCTATGFRLPSGKEWELAARWRNNATNTVPGYNDPYFTKGNSASGAWTYYNDTNDSNSNGTVDGKDANDLVAVYPRYWDGDSLEPTGVTGTSDVKSKGPNGMNSLGLYDMSGNVWEWGFDIYPGMSQRYILGHSWKYDNSASPQLSYALYWNSYTESDHIGFRLAKTE